MLILSVIIFAVILFLTFKFVKNEIIEVLVITGVTVLCKVLVKDISFYPLFAMPVLLALRYKKPYSVIYTLVIITVVNIVDGFGLWSIAQYAIYGLISGVTYIARNVLNKQNKLVVFGYNFVIMFMFGVLMDVFSFYTGNFLGYPNVISNVIAGLPFDLNYAISGVIYGGIFTSITYLSSVNIKEIVKIKKMTLEKSC